MKRELKGKIEKLVVYETEREYQGTFIDSIGKMLFKTKGNAKMVRPV